MIQDAINIGIENNVLVHKGRNKYSILINKPYIIPEKEYYSQVKVAINDLWHRDGYKGSEYFIEKTAHSDSKIVGPWTRPDFTIISFRKYSWTIGVEFDIVTFEVKKPGSCNVLAVFEALSHASVATRAYVVFPIDEKTWIASDPKQANRVREECLRHGVGLILVGDVSRTPRATQVIRASRNEIDHQRCNDFLFNVISQDGKNQIAAWK